MVGHFRVFSYKCFMLKHGNLDKFESRSSNRIFLGYALHSRAYCIFNLLTNRVVETCEVTLDETMPCTSPIFEHVDHGRMGETIFMEEDLDNAY